MAAPTATATATAPTHTPHARDAEAVPPPRSLARSIRNVADGRSSEDAHQGALTQRWIRGSTFGAPSADPRTHGPSQKRHPRAHARTHSIRTHAHTPPTRRGWRAASRYLGISLGNLFFEGLPGCGGSRRVPTGSSEGANSQHSRSPARVGCARSHHVRVPFALAGRSLCLDAPPPRLRSRPPTATPQRHSEPREDAKRDLSLLGRM